jgi:glycosyltransferase Alg8
MKKLNDLKMKLPVGTGGFLIFTLALAVAFSLLPHEFLDPGSKKFIFVLGVLAMWRYSWGLLHFVRSIIYRKVVFPRWRKTADENSDALMPSHIYLMITAFRIAANTTMKVYEATIREAIACGAPTTIVASIVELSDEFMIKEQFRAANPPPHVRLMIVRIPGTGKRDGLAQGFRAISRDMPAPDAVVAVIDGDSILGENLIRKCSIFFKLRPNLGALTTDEDCIVEGSKLFKEWYSMRFAQRQIQMCSVALSGRVMTLTGRMSMFRASIVTHPDFISHVESDYLDHWRLGRFKFLTGDDKSSLFSVLKAGYETLYIPDVVVYTVEHPPGDNFIQGTTQLMFRWFGNMLRTNSRVLALGPTQMPLFVWWCFVDQRISMWTALSGPTFAILLSLKYGLIFIPIYLTWVGFTRWVMAMMLLSSRPVLSWYYPFLIYYNQIWGSCIKTYVMFRLDRQSWTRQKTKLNRGLTAGQEAWVRFTSFACHATSVLVFVTVIGLISGFFTFPTDLLGTIFG